VDISEAGNTPTWKITGVVYLPNSSDGLCTTVR